MIRERRESESVERDSATGFEKIYRNIHIIYLDRT